MPDTEFEHLEDSVKAKITRFKSFVDSANNDELIRGGSAG